LLQIKNLAYSPNSVDTAFASELALGLTDSSKSTSTSKKSNESKPINRTATKRKDQCRRSILNKVLVDIYIVVIASTLVRQCIKSYGFKVLA
tara:strand:- start:932 stop:1207 length:276 start_codon:yes stop_codon:yes gene_type:complete